MAINSSGLLGAKAPTQLFADFVSWAGGQGAHLALAKWGGIRQVLSGVSSGEVEVINEQSSGVLTFAGQHTSTATPLNNIKFKIVIDDVIVLDVNQTLTDEDGIASAVGTFSILGTQVSGISEGSVVFNKSLVIFMSGNGSVASELSYDYYLT